MAFLGGGRGFPRYEGLLPSQKRLENVSGLNDARCEPSRLRPLTVVADVDVE